MNRLEAALARGPQYRAALHLLTNTTVFRHKPRWIEAFLPADGGIDFPRMLSQGHWSTGERCAIEAAASIFGCCPDGKNPVLVNLLDLRVGLDATSRQVLYEAVEHALA